MTSMGPSDYSPEESARQAAERMMYLRETRHAVRYEHSRAGLLARFMQRLADGIDPTGEARRQDRPRP
jgi:hypothetical protein